MTQVVEPFLGWVNLATQVGLVTLVVPDIQEQVVTRELELLVIQEQVDIQVSLATLELGHQVILEQVDIQVG
jgi:hypothetical protein